MPDSSPHDPAEFDWNEMSGVAKPTPARHQPPSDLPDWTNLPPLTPDWSRSRFFAFRLMITPVIMRVVFVIGLPVIAIGTLIYFVAIYSNAREVTVLFFPFALLCCVALLVLWRIACELAMVAFSINDRLGEIAAELKKRK